MPTEQLAKFAEYVEALRGDLRTDRHFELRVNVYDPAIDATRQLKEASLRFVEAFPRTVRPLLGRAAVCRVYRLPTDRDYRRGFNDADYPPERVDHWRRYYLHGAKGAYEVELAPDVIDDVSFWWWIFRIGSTPVFTLDRSALNLQQDFAHFRDPVIIGNEFAGPRKSAFKWALGQTESGDRVAFIGGGSSYGVDLSVVSTEADMVPLFEAALAYGDPSPDFIRGQGTYYVVPLEIGGYDLWIKLNSNRETWTSILFTTLERADEHADDDARALLDGLVGAELIAALSGRPPASYGRREPRRAQGLAEWVERLAPTNPFGPQVRELARRIVQRTREQSVLPERLWRTEEPRRLWREAMLDLERRLG